MRSWLGIGIPCLLAIGLVGFALSRRGGVEDVRTADPTPAQVAAKMLPDYGKGVNPGTDHPVTVDEVRVEHSDPPKLIGVARNNSGHVVHSAEILCEIMGPQSSRMGAVTAHVGEIAPYATARFEIEIAQDTAKTAVVSEIHAH